MTQTGPIASLDHPRSYEEELERLRLKHEGGGRLFLAEQGGASLATLSWHAGGLSRLLCRTVMRGEYRFGIAEEHLALVGGKVRSLYRMGPADTVVAGVVSRVLAGLVRPGLSPRCYSYQKGRSSRQALADLAAFVRAHRRERPDPRKRGLYVLRRDVSAYGESVPVGEGSPLWPMLDEALDRGGVPAAHPLRSLVRDLVRPVIRTLDGQEARFEVGTPTGSPVQPVVNNLYLSPVDRALDGIPGGFYARFGDDFAFAHPDPGAAREASARVDAIVASLGLSIGEGKRADCYFTAPGRPSPDWPGTRPISGFEYLGCRVGFDGTVGLKRDKVRRLLRDVRHRILNANRILGTAPADERAAVACAVAARVLDPRDLLAHPLAPLLRDAVDDRRQLAQLDYRIALAVAEAVSGRRGPRAFRRVPWREQRRRFGLPSLVHLRNAGGREDPGGGP